MSEDDTKKSSKHWADLLIIIIPIIAVVVLLLILLNKKEGVEIIDNSENNKIESMVCTSKDGNIGVFVSNRAKKVENKIKVFFENKVFNKISYNYTGEFETEEVAEDAKDIYLADYNIYMGEQGVSASILVPTFSQSDNTVLINLVTSRDDISATTARFFFLESIEYNNIKNFPKERIRELYMKKGFICEE